MDHFHELLIGAGGSNLGLVVQVLVLLLQVRVPLLQVIVLQLQRVAYGSEPFGLRYVLLECVEHFCVESRAGLLCGLLLVRSAGLVNVPVHHTDGASKKVVVIEEVLGHVVGVGGVVGAGVNLGRAIAAHVAKVLIVLVVELRFHRLFGLLRERIIWAGWAHCVALFSSAALFPVLEGTGFTLLFGDGLFCEAFVHALHCFG